jgi:hypothetical protein
MTKLMLLLPAAAALAAQSPYLSEKTPDGRPVCAAWVHDQYKVNLNGRMYATWHPPIDPVYNCAFGHEHGSDPRAFRHFAQTGMPAFGAVHPGGMRHGEEEAHAGFKVYVVNNDGRGKSWMVVLHQGSGSPRRADVRRHSLQVWMFRNRDNLLLARTGVMADFGEFVGNCDGSAFRHPMRLIPQSGCTGIYESWNVEMDVGGAFRSSAAFDIDNATTAVEPANLELIRPNLPAACGPYAWDGWDSYCKGDKRSILHPKWVLRNTGPADEFCTTAEGQRTSCEDMGAVRQFVRRGVRVDESAECCGSSVVYIMTNPADGGIYRRQDDRANRGQAGSVNFETREYSIRWPN